MTTAISFDTIEQYYLHADTLTRIEFRDLHERNMRNMRAFLAADGQYHQALDAHLNAHPDKTSVYRDFPADDAMYEAHLQRKAAFYQFSLTDVAHAKHASAHGTDRSRLPITSYIHYQQEHDNFQQWITSQPNSDDYVYQVNPTIDTDYHYRKVRRMLAAYTGLRPWKIDQAIRKLQHHRKLSQHEAVVQYYFEASQRTDKDFIYLDLETAARIDEGMAMMDTGQYSEILEIGYEKEYRNGQIESGTMLLDCDPNLKRLAGTGAQHIHNISEEMIQGQPHFSDPAIQQRITELIDNAVIVAHGANFEITNFSFALRGFTSQWRDVVDTKDLTTYFVHTINGNRNQDLVETTGGTYLAAAHRALPDAQMTRRSTREVLANRQTYYAGDHPANTALRAQAELTPAPFPSTFESEDTP